MEYVAADNGRELILRYMLWLAKEKIQTKNSQKKGESEGPCLTPDTKKKYLENFVSHLQASYGSHPDVYGLKKGDDFDLWWKKVKVAFEKTAQRSTFTDDVRDSKIKALYRLTDEMQHYELNEDGTDFFNLDLHSILKGMLKDASRNVELAMYRLLIVITYLSVGRGGEGKFVRWESSFWDLFLKAFVSNWLQPKTMEEDLMPYTPDKELFSCDILHSFGVYFTLCDGLYRDPHEHDKKLLAARNFIFPSLHKHRDDFVAKKITALLTKYTPDAYKDTTSAKSLRIGSNTSLAMHRDVTFHMQQSRGGWSSGSKSDVYQENCPQLTYYAGACLSGWNDCTRVIEPPNLECIGVEDQEKLNSFMNHLYLHDTTTMPRFAPRGDLRPFLRTVTAAILRYHEDFVAEYGANHLFVRKVFQAARKGAIGSTDNEISMKLLAWCKKVRDDFMNRNIDLHTNTTNEKLLAQLVEEMSKQNHLMTQFLQQNAAILKNQEELKSRLINVELGFQMRADALQQQLMLFSGKFHSVSPTPCTPLSGNKHQRDNVDDSKWIEEGPSEKKTCVSNTTLLQILPSDIPTSTHNLEIKNLVKYHYVSKHFHASYMGKFHCISTPPFYEPRDKSKHKILMKLFQKVWDNDTMKQFTPLFSPHLDESQLSSLCSLFQQQTMFTMALLEVAQMEIHGSEEKKQMAIANIMTSSKKKPYVIGVANRFQAVDLEGKTHKSSSQTNSPLKRFLNWVGGSK